MTKFVLALLTLATLQPALAMEGTKRSRDEYIEEHPIKTAKTKQLNRSKFLWHVQNGNSKKVAHLLASGAHPDTANADGLTALARAAHAGYEDICEQLIAAGANVNIADTNGNTPLIWASKGNQRDIYDLLKYYGANVNTRNATGNTADSYLDGTASDFVYEGDDAPCAMQ